MMLVLVVTLLGQSGGLVSGSTSITPTPITISDVQMCVQCCTPPAVAELRAKEDDSHKDVWRWVAGIGSIIMALLFFVQHVGQKLDKIVGAWRRSELKFPFLPKAVAVALVFSSIFIGLLDLAARYNEAHIIAEPFRHPPFTHEEQTGFEIRAQACKRACEPRVVHEFVDEISPKCSCAETFNRGH